MYINAEKANLVKWYLKVKNDNNISTKYNYVFKKFRRLIIQLENWLKCSKILEMFKIG